MNINKCSNFLIKYPRVNLTTIRKLKIKHKAFVERYIQKLPDSADIKTRIPPEYFELNRSATLENLYLIDKRIAKRVVDHVLPYIQYENHVVAETNAGLALITVELLKKGIPLVKLYEACPEFRVSLVKYCLQKKLPVEIYKKGLFQLARYSYMDKFDNQKRIAKLFSGVPKKDWQDDPCMTIIGPMGSTKFIGFLIKDLTLQTEVIQYGRFQIFALMRPYDYYKLNADPKDTARFYHWWSIICQLLFDYELLDSYPRKSFLPWDVAPTTGPRSKNTDQIFLVRLCFKKDLFIEVDRLSEFLYFLKRVYGRGGNKAILSVEKLIPGCGLHALVPSLEHEHYFKNLSIFTRMVELTPQEILSLFKEVINHPKYDRQSMTSMALSTYLKSETIEEGMYQEADCENEERVV